MPTAFDFSLLANFIYTQPLMFRNSFLMFDPFRLLESFFREPPALRLSLCAIVADAIRLPEEVCLSYYSRARKALLRITEPSLKAIQALYLCATFALMNGQVALGIPAMDRAIHMLLDLNLEHDPDDNPIFRHLNEKERDEVRRTFWVFNYAVKMMRLQVGPDSMRIIFTAKGMKPCHDIGDPMMLPMSLSLSAPTVFVCGLIDIMEGILKHVWVPPASVDAIIYSGPIIAQHEARLQIWYQQLPARLKLLPSTLTSKCLNHCERSGIIVLYMYHRAALCNLHRPMLYLTGVRSVRPNEAYTCRILDSVQISLKSAQEMCDISRQILNITNPNPSAIEHHTQHGVMQLTRFFWQENYGLCVGLFEAAVVCWYFLCRGDVSWWYLLCPILKETETELRIRLKYCVETCVQSLRVFETMMDGGELSPHGRAEKPNMMTPMVNCIEAMLEEIRRVQTIHCGVVGEASPSDNTERRFEGMLMEMRVLPLGKVTQQVEAEAQPAWVLLGLLGAEVYPGIRWRAGYEASWRNFWDRATQNNT
ncbi:hypothetical protein BC830DRAFT_844274 [Chytriomyces sp. MP71]|nr:hypothetical protein BC830DRAFT_844274 [Chytriomyces sp. MP71]